MNRNIAVILSARDAGLARQLGAAAAAITAFEHQVERSASFGSKLATAAKVGFSALGVAAVVGLGMAINKAAEFEVAMRNVNSISHMSEGVFRSMSEQVLELSTKMPQSANTLAEGLYQIASSGFRGAAGMTVLKASATAATAGMTDTETSARAIVSVLNAYGLSARDAAAVSDVLFATVDVGIVTFEELANQLGDFIGAGAAAGIEIDDLGAAFAAMTLSGLPAAEAATSLNNLLRKLIKPSEYLTDVFHNLGYESGQAAIDQLGLYGTMNLLRKATGGTITETQKLFPEIRAARGAYALFAADGENYARTQAFIGDETQRAGSTQRAFREQMKAVGNQAKLLGNQITAAGIEIGSAFLPIVADAIGGIRKLGGTLGDAFNSFKSAATPAINAVKGAFGNLSTLFDEIGKTASPAARGLAKFVGGLSIGAVTGFATALGGLAGGLAKVPGLVTALTIALGGFAVSATASALVTRFANSLVYLRIQIAALTAQNVLSTLASRITLFAQGLGSVFTMGSVGNISKMGAAFSGLGGALKGVLASPWAAGTVLIGGLMSLQSMFDKARQKAKDFISTLDQKFDTNTLEGLEGKTNALATETERLDKEWEELGGNNVTRTLRGVAEWLLPIEDKVVNNIEATNAYRNELGRTRQEQALWQHDISTLSNELGISESAVSSWLRKLGDYDPLDMTTTTADLADQIREMQITAAGTSPAMENMKEALTTGSDAAITAADRVELFTGSLDAMISTMLGTFDAETNFAQSIHDLTESLNTNGQSMDAWNEKGRANRAALSGSVSAALEWAKQMATSTGDVQGAADALSVMRERIISTAQAQGMSREEAENYVNQLNLTPDTIETVMSLVGDEEAAGSLKALEAMEKAVGEARIEPEVNLKAEDFNNDARIIGETLANIGQANPEAVVTLDGKPFKATAEQVTLWSDMYDDSTWQAQALLDIIDPQNKFVTLSDAAAGWASVYTSAHAGLVEGEATTKYGMLDTKAVGWGGTRSSAVADLRESAARTKYAQLDAESAQWGNTSDSATAGVNDNASGILGRILGMLGNIDGYVATSTINVTTNRTEIRQTVDAGVRPQRMPMRWGGVLHARSGTKWEAGIAYEPMVSWGERGTGGEAYIPKNGSFSRSFGILQQAASWYGLGVTELGRHAGNMGMGGLMIAPQINVNIKPTAGVDNKALVDYARQAMGAEMDKFTRNMTRMLRQRSGSR